MRVLYGHDRTVAEFVAQLAPIERPGFAGFAGALGIINNDGALVGGVVFSDWRPDFGTVEVSAAALDPRALGKASIIRELGAYPFGPLRCYRMWARTAETNLRTRKFLTGIGFREEAVNAHHYGYKRHAILARVLKPEWMAKWESGHGRQRSQHPVLSGSIGPERLRRHESAGLVQPAKLVDEHGYGATESGHALW
jgi:RimJ/RimL family protein N-acetyltransferase